MSKVATVMMLMAGCAGAAEPEPTEASCRAAVSRNLRGAEWSVVVEVREHGWCGTHPPFAWRGEVRASGEARIQRSAEGAWEPLRPFDSRELAELRAALLDQCAPAPPQALGNLYIDDPYVDIVSFRDQRGRSVAAPPGYSTAHGIAARIGLRTP